MVEAKLEDEDDGAFEIPGFKAGAGGAGEVRTSRRRSRNSTVKYQEDDEEDENSEDDLGSNDDASDSPSSSSSTTSSYHESRRPSTTTNTTSTSSISSKPKPKSSKPPPPSKTNSNTSSSSNKRRVSAPLLEPSSSRQQSSPLLPLKRVKLSPTSSSPSDFLSLPPLPDDFDSYGEGGASRFLGEDHHSGGVAIPDFSGREDCWGIGKEAYQKLSAKAKKQLR